jgi:hypothetical protein
MLTDPEKIRIISKAKQKNVRDPNRSRFHFNRIFSDFFNKVQFEGSVFLDLGPGQYDFGVLAKQRGAFAYCIDDDPAVVELDRYKGFPVRYGNIENIRAEDFDRAFDAVFCKYSINAFWFNGDDRLLEDHIKEIGRLIKSGGWAWIAPWNGVPQNAGLTQDDIKRVLSVQAEVFKQLGFAAFNLSDRLSRYYGIHGDTANRALFILNLRIPWKLWICTKL